MKVIDSRGTKNRTTSTIDLFEGVTVPKGTKKRINDLVGEYLIEQIQENLDAAKSTVTGESFQALSKEYKQFKSSQGGSSIPDLLLSGDLRASLSHKAGENLEIGFFDSEAWKADGHLKFSGKENGIPKRRFLPEEGQKFRPEIEAGIRDIMRDELSDDDLQDVIDELGL